MLSTIGQERWLPIRRAVRDKEDMLHPDEQTKWAEKIDRCMGYSRKEEFKQLLNERGALE